MKKVIQILSLILLIGIITYIGLTPGITPKAKKGPLTKEEFDVDRAIDHLNVICRKGHPSGSDNIVKVRDYLVEYLQSLNLNPRIINGIKTGHNVDNILAVIPGQAKSEGTLLMVAHYDSYVFNIPGAADDGYGIGTLLETARAIVESGKLYKNDIYILLTDAEERGFKGAMAFAETEKDLLKKIDIVMNFDARGNKGPMVLFETSPGNKSLINFYKKSVPYPLAYSFAQDIHSYIPNYTDFYVFNEHAVKGYNFAAINGLDIYHTPADNLDNIDRDTIYNYGVNALALVKKLAGLTKQELEKIQSSKDDAVYFPITRSFLISYSNTWVIPLSGCLMLVVILILVFIIRKKDGSLKKIAAGFFSFLTGILLSAAAAASLFFLIKKIFKPQMLGVYVKSFEYSNVCMILLIILTLAISLVMVFVLLKKHTFPQLLAPLLFLYAALLPISLIYMKGISYVFMLPLFFFSLSIGLHYYIKAGKVRNMVIFFLTAVPPIILFSPAIQFLYIALTLSQVTILMLFTALLAIPVCIASKLLLCESEQSARPGKVSTN